MTFIQAFEKIKTRLKSASISENSGNFAIQIELTNKDCSGIFYIKNDDGFLSVEPYDYHDNDAAVSLSYLSLSKLFDGRINPSEAVEKGTIKIEGDASKLNAICAVVPEQDTLANASASKAKPKKTDND